MELIELQMQDKLIIEAIHKSMSYSAYVNLIEQLVKDNSTTGNEKTEALADYTKLNQRRMNRWDKTIKITEAHQLKIQNFNKSVTWLVLTESWCGDAAHILPVINKVAELNDHINFRIVLRDQHDDLMNLFLTNGGKSIPKLLMLDKTSNEVLNTFGPRPKIATDMVSTFKKEYGKLTTEFKEDLQRWYNKDKGQSVIDDLLKLLD